MKKRYFAALLSLVMMLSLLPVNALAAEGGTSYDNASKAKEDTLVEASKTATVNPEDGTITVTLSVQGAQESTKLPADVVLVVDTSGSMAWCTGEGHTHSVLSGCYTELCTDRSHYDNHGNHKRDTTCVEIYRVWYKRTCTKHEHWTTSDGNGCGNFEDDKTTSKTDDRRITYAKAAATTFVDGLLTTGSNINVGLADFSGRGRIASYLTQNSGDLKDGIEGLSAAHKDGTSYYEGLVAAEEILRNGTSSNQKFIIFISDGEPNNGEYGTKKAATLQNAGVTIMTVGIGLTDSQATHLKNISSTGTNNKKYYYSSTGSDLKNVLSNVKSQVETLIHSGEDAVMTDTINTDYFELAQDPDKLPADLTYDNSGKLTWDIGEIGSTKKTVSFKIQPKDGNTTTGNLYTNSNVELTFKSTALDEDVTFTKGAIGEPKVGVYSVTYTDGANGTVFADQTTYNLLSDGKNASETPKFDTTNIANDGKGNPTRDNYTFKGWSPTVETKVGGTTYNIVYTAQWEPDSVGYTIEYYYDNQIDGSKTVTDTANVGDTIKTYTDKNKAGYKFNKVVPSELSISATATNNVMRVYYVKDASQTQETKYTVKYTVEGTLKNDDTVKVNGTAWIGETSPQIAIAEGGIPAPANKYPGYKLDLQNPTYPAAGTTVASGTEYTVNYVKDSTQTKDTKYTVHYYLDSVEQMNDKVEETGTAWVNDNPAKIKIVNEIAPDNKYEGYKLDTAKNGTYPAKGDEVNSGSEYNVYYAKRTDLTYTVKYVDKDTGTEIKTAKTGTAAFGATITAVSEKITIDGYTYDSADKDSITIGTTATDNVLTLKYAKNPPTPATFDFDNVDGHDDGTGTVSAITKTVKGNVGKEFRETFTVTVTPNDASKSTMTTSTLSGEADVRYGSTTNVPFVFGESSRLTFTEEGTYTYTVQEVKGSTRHMSYDTSVYTLTITVELDEDSNTLNVTSYTFVGGMTETANGALRIVNSYSSYRPSPSATTNKPKLNRDDHYAYVMGYPDGTVQPNGNITRAEAATIFFRLLTDESREEYWATSNDYSDVSANDWYNNAISTLSNAGIVSGYPDGTFRPNAQITRAEMSKIIALFAELEKNADRFNDISGHWAEAYIKLAAGNGWIAGYPDGSFRPDQKITRAETMTMINRVLERVPSDEDHLLSERVMLTFPDCKSGAWYYIAVQEATNSHTYERAETEKNGDEQWIKLIENRDWSKLEY